MIEGPFEYSFEVRLHDTDAAGVLFFAHLLRHAHDAFESLMATAGFSLQDLIRDGAVLPIVHTEADYQAPIRQGDRMRVEVTVSDVRRRSFTLGYRFLDAEGHVRARAGTIHVLTGPGQNPVLPAGLVQALARWQLGQEPEAPRT